MTVGSVRRVRNRQGRDRRLRSGPDAQRTARVAPDDRAAACADGVQVDGRQPDRQTADRALARALGPAAAIRHTSVDVPPMSNEIAFSMPASARDAGGADDPAGRARTRARRRVLRGLVDRGDAARRAHDERLGQARLAAARRERAQVARDDRAEVRVRGGRRRALVLAELGRDLVRRDDVRVREPPPQLLRDRTLVRSGRGTRGAGRPRPPRASSSGSEPRSSGTSTPSGPDPPAHTVAALERHERLRRGRARPVEMRARLAAQVEQVLEARIGDERRPRALPLEQRVRRDRRPVRERSTVAGAGGPRGRDDRFLLPRGRQNLRRADPTLVERGPRR